MTGKKIIISLAVLLLLTAGGVFLYSQNTPVPDEPELSSETDSEPDSETESQSEPEFETETLLQNPPEYPELAPELPESSPQEVLLRAEAEHAQYTGNLYPEELPECSNGTCISGFSVREGDSIQAAFMIPAAQHYNLTVSVKASAPGTNALLLNGVEIGRFTLSDTEHFTRFTVSGIWLPAGQAELSIQETDGNFSVDYFEISDHTELAKIKYQKQYELSDPEASENARKLMNFLSEHYGNHVLSGQYTDSDKNTELDMICQITGHYPAIRFGEMRSYSGNTSEESRNIIQACQNWAVHGGIVGLSWYWDAPSGIADILTEKTDFSLSEAIPDSTLTDENLDYQIDAALLSEAEIETALENQQISPECAAILHDIDQISEALQTLAEQDIPVLWRPLPEAGGGWYWWGADGSQSYRWLWDVLYRRMTEYHHLHNLIWLWNGQNESFLVNRYDIAVMDLYPDENQPFGSRYEEFLWLYRMTKHKKILAVSECGSLPDVNLLCRDHTLWSFTALWNGDYLKNTEEEALRNFYCSEKVLTLDEIKTP
ncbi:MAG: hypothetical protein IJ642_10140 [Oscillospiraceae bacterium]|nr:hypothetical protein [Oscillospiraceae bacterium]